MKEIIYIGNSYKMMQYLLSSTDFELKKIVCEKKRISREIQQLSKQVSVIGVEDKKQLEQAIFDAQISIAVMYDFGLIIPKRVLEKVNVYNFHPGSLLSNRGSSPLNWSVLLGDHETEMSLYKVSDKIDLGVLVAAKRCRIYKDDSPSILRKRLENSIPELLRTLNDYLDGEFSGNAVNSGIYRKRIVEEDYTIDLKNDSFKRIQSKIQSQMDYAGALLKIENNEMKYFVRSMEDLRGFGRSDIEKIYINKKEKTKMKILVTGLLTLHWGRVEYGNIGNYYIVVPLFRKLHEYFPKAEIVTTLQLTDEFCEREKITKLPWEYYYAWREDSQDTKEALEELAIAQIFHSTGELVRTTKYIKEVMTSDLVINFSGDMWGDNSTGMGENRFLVDLLKFRTAQLLGVKTMMFASSPGPVTERSTLEFAKEVYANLDLVVNREGFSIKILEEEKFDISKTYSCACPSFLFNKECYPVKVDDTIIRKNEGITNKVKNIGFILATYSLPGHSFDDWERCDEDFKDYVELIEYIINEKKERVVLISHSNGFELPPNFKRTHWRDYKMISQLYEIIKKRNKVDMNLLHKVDNIYDPWEMHTLIGQLDMLISGRVHGAVAGLEQYVPTLAFDYKNGPLAHKMFGFFDLMGMGDCVIPRDDFDFIKYFNKMYAHLEEIRERLKINHKEVKDKVELGFKKMKELVEE